MKSSTQVRDSDSSPWDSQVERRSSLQSYFVQLKFSPLLKIPLNQITIAKRTAHPKDCPWTRLPYQKPFQNPPGSIIIDHLEWGSSLESCCARPEASLEGALALSTPPAQHLLWHPDRSLPTFLLFLVFVFFLILKTHQCTFFCFTSDFILHRKRNGVALENNRQVKKIATISLFVISLHTPPCNIMVYHTIYGLHACTCISANWWRKHLDVFTAYNRWSFAHFRFN